MAFGLSAGAIAGLAGAGLGAYSATQNKKAAQAGASSTQSLDPRANNILYGNNEDGLLKQFQQIATHMPASAEAQRLGYANGNYINQYASSDMDAIRNAGQGLLRGNAAPQSAFGGDAPSAAFGGQAQASAFGGQAQASTFGGEARMTAPGQNGLSLSGSFDRFINGDAGSNPYLLKGQQAAIDATNAGFAKNQTDLTNNLQRNVLPGIRSSAIGAGQFGGSRQAIVEANALSDYTNQLTSANTQLGLANSANTTAQQAAAFNQGQDRSLNATLNLSGQQYSAAAKAADLKFAANQMNQQNNQFNSNLQQHAMDQNQVNNQFNSNLQQRAMEQNQQNNQYNSGLKLQANQMAQQNNQFNAAQQAQANQQNNAAALSGAGLLSGQLGAAATGLQNWDNYAVNRAQQSASLLAPFIGMNSSSTSTQPSYSNTAGNVLGGAAAGLGLYQQFSSMGGGSNSSSATPYSGSANNWGVQAGTAPAVSLPMWGG